MPDMPLRAEDHQTESTANVMPIRLAQSRLIEPSPRAQIWRDRHDWTRKPPVVTTGFTEDSSRTVLFENDRRTSGTYLIAMQDAILNWADNILKDGVLYTRFADDTASYAVGVSKQKSSHGWKVGTGLHPYGEGVAIHKDKLKPQVRINSPVFLATPDEPGNWGLFLLQSLPAALRFVRDKKRYGKFLCHAPPGNHRELLRLAGVSDDDFIYHDVSKTHLLREVRFIQSDIRDLAISEEDRALFLSLAAKVLKDHHTRRGTKIFLSRRMRSGEPGVYRILRNELALRHALENAGFDCVETEYMGPINQIRTMAGAEVVVGLGGAGMFNTVFCSAGTRVLDIESTARFTNAHTNIFASCNLVYGVHIGRELPDQRRSDHHDWEVDVSQVLTDLNAMEVVAVTNDSQIYCRVDRMDGGIVSGWAFDRRKPDEPLDFAVFVDGRGVGVFQDFTLSQIVVCSTKRADVAALNVGPELSGYSFHLPKNVLDGEQHVLQFRSRTGERLQLHFADGDFDERLFSHLWHPRLLSAVEYIEGGVVKGWVIAAELETGHFVGRQRVSLHWKGMRIGSTIADDLLTEGDDELALGMKCAFSFQLPPWLLLETAPLLRVVVDPQHEDLVGSPLRPMSKSEGERAAAVALLERLSRLQDEVSKTSALARQAAFTSFPRGAFGRWDAEVVSLLNDRVKQLPSQPMGRICIFVLTCHNSTVELAKTLASIADQTEPGIVVKVLTEETAIDLFSTVAASFQLKVHIDVLCRTLEQLRWSDLEAYSTSTSAEWLMILQSGDTLRPYAWALLSRTISKDLSFIYFDDIDETGPRLKPAWNRRLAEHGNIIGKSIIIRTSTISHWSEVVTDAFGQTLLLTAQSQTIRHVALVLAEVFSGAAASVPISRSDEYGMIQTEASKSLRPLQTRPTISILFADEWDPGQLRRCIDLLLAEIDYPVLDFVVCTSPVHFELILKHPIEVQVGRSLRHVDVDGYLQTGERLKLGLAAIETEFVLLISDGIIRPGAQWLHALIIEMIGHPDVAAVGGKNLDIGGHILNAGLILSRESGLSAVGAGSPSRAPGYLSRYSAAQDVVALSGPSILLRHSVGEHLINSAIEAQSVSAAIPDFCLRLVEAGLRAVWTPEGVATIVSLQDEDLDEKDFPKPETRYYPNQTTLRDPFYNPSFAWQEPFYTQLVPPRQAVTQAILSICGV